VEEILGYKPEEIVGQKLFYDLYPSDMREQMKKVAFEFFATKRAFNKYGSFAVHKNGGIVSLDISGLPILDNRGDLLGYRGICINTTEYRKLEAQLRHSQKMEAVGSLAGGIAHDFNNILNVIIGYGSMVYDRIEAGSHAKEQMNEVLIAADRAANLTKRLLVFSRDNVLEMKPVNINALILGLQKMLDRIIREDIDFTVELADRPLIVLADTGLIEQVLMNLATNAKDAMKEGGRLTIGTGVVDINNDYVAAYGYGKPGSYALITVADTGQGMDAETQKKIFEPFFTTKGIGEGTGLGLAITYGITKQHDGYINVSSEPGQGTVFKIYLPLTEGTTSPDMKTDATVTVKGGNETVLLAEDDVSLREVTRIILESFGYTVISAEDGEDAITKFMENRERISVALIDMIMPKKNGKEAGEAMRRVSPRIKILYESGYTMDIIKTDEMTDAGVDFIHKPFQPRDLLVKMRELLDK
jgi:PAS domain S-box-containing protein